MNLAFAVVPVEIARSKRSVRGGLDKAGCDRGDLALPLFAPLVLRGSVRVGASLRDFFFGICKRPVPEWRVTV
jgi:hypothetical protein